MKVRTLVSKYRRLPRRGRFIVVHRCSLVLYDSASVNGTKRINVVWTVRD